MAAPLVVATCSAVVDVKSLSLLEVVTVSGPIWMVPCVEDSADTELEV